MPRRLFAKIINKSGVTLVELLVSFFLISLLMVFIVSAYLFTQRFILNWEDEISIYQEADFILQLIKNDFNNYNSIRSDDSALIFTDDILGRLTYSVSGGDIFKNNRIINGSGFSCVSFKVEKINLTYPTPDSILISGRYDLTFPPKTGPVETSN